MFFFFRNWFSVFPHITVWGSCFSLGSRRSPPASASRLAASPSSHISHHILVITPQLITAPLLTPHLSHQCGRRSTQNLLAELRRAWPPLGPWLAFTHYLSHTTLSHTIFDTPICHTHHLSHTHLCHTHTSLSHCFVTHHLSHIIFHTTLSNTIFHTPSLTRHLLHTTFHTPSFTRQFLHGCEIVPKYVTKLYVKDGV